MKIKTEPQRCQYCTLYDQSLSLIQEVFHVDNVTCPECTGVSCAQWISKCGLCVGCCVEAHDPRKHEELP